MPGKEHRGCLAGSCASTGGRASGDESLDDGNANAHRCDVQGRISIVRGHRIDDRARSEQQIDHVRVASCGSTVQWLQAALVKCINRGISCEQQAHDLLALRCGSNM